MLLLAFAMLSQRRILSLIHLFALQGVDAVAVDAHGRATSTGQTHLYVSALLTLRAQGGRCCPGSCTG